MSSAFMLDKAKIKQSFSAASATYDSVADLQRSIGKALLKTCTLNSPGGIILDLGCGTGFLTNELLDIMPIDDIPSLIALDIAWPMLEKARKKLPTQQNLSYLCADLESLPIATRSIDGVFSNLALQWCRSPQMLFINLKRIIKPNGCLVFSTFGPDTLFELKNAWAEVDDFCHVNEFYGADQLEQHLKHAGFREIRISSQSYQQTYASVIDLMRELKLLGAHNVLTGRNKLMTTKTQLHKMMATYEKHRINNLIPATFAAIFISAKA